MSVNDLARPSIARLKPIVPPRPRALPEGIELLPLGANENQLGTSPLAVEAMRAAAAGVAHYPDAFAVALRQKLAARFGLDESGKNVTMTPGSVGFFNLVADTFVNPGDEMLTCGPTFDYLHGEIGRYGGAVVELPLTPDQRFDLAAMAAHVTDATKIVYVCNPNNPTGTLVDPDELRSFVRSMPDHVITLVDEAYLEFADDPDANTMLGEIVDGVNLVVMRTFSKIYGMAGARLGYAFANDEVSEVLQKANHIFPAPVEVLAAGMAALDDDDFIARSRAMVGEGRAYLTRELEALGWKVWPSQTNFVYADSGLDGEALREALAARGLMVRDGYACTRITVGTPEQNAKAVAVICATLEQESLSERA